MAQPMLKRPRRRRGAHPRAAERRRSLEGDFERDAGATRELEELERAEREQRRMLEGEPAPERRNVEE